MLLRLSAHLHVSRLLGILVLCCLWFFGAIAASANTQGPLHQGMTRAEIIEALGPPTSAATMGEREILQFRNAVRVELHQGKLFTARGVQVLSARPAPPTSAPAPVTVKPAAEPIKKAVPPAAPAEEVVPPPPPLPTPLAIRQRGDELEYLEADELYFPEEEVVDLLGLPPAFEPDPTTAILIELGLLFVFFFIVIRVAFEVVGMPILTSQTIKIVVGYVLVSGALLIIPAGAEVREHFYINHFIRFLSLCALINACSDASQGLTILKIALATHIASIVLTFLAVMTLLMVLAGMA